MKKLFEYSAFIYAFLIFLGYSYIDIYFDSFGISIYSYLDASEILLSFLNRVTFLVLMGIAIILYLLLIYFVVRIKGKDKSKLEIKTDSNEVKEVTKSDKILINLGLVSTFGVMIFALYSIADKIINGSFDDKVIIIILLIIGLCFLGYHKLPILFNTIGYNLSIKNQRLIYLIITICFFNYISAIIKYNRVYKEVEKIEFSFTYESKSYKSCDSLRYIGATSKYIFVWNLISSNNYVFPKEEIKNLRIKNIVLKKSIN